MKETDNYDKSRQLQIEDYLQEDKLETECIVEVPSNISGTFKGINDQTTIQNIMLEDILSNYNMNLAYKRVKENKGSHGVDGMKVDELLTYLKQNGDQIKQDILSGTYNPQAIRRVEIPKENGKKRKLGIPVVVDRVIQQAIAQVLTPIYENKFSENSYGFRPNKSAHQAIKKCEEYINDGYKWAVDIDLAQFFDKVNHDKLIQIMSKDIKDGRILSLISKYLRAKVSINGKLEESLLGTPQGGSISPLLSNIMLNELDVELTKRGLHFVRYADDCNIYVKTRKAAERVMKSITKFIEEKLLLEVNKDKSKIDRPWKLKFLGISFYNSKSGVRIRIHEKSLVKFKKKLREITSRSNGMSIEQKVKKLNQCIIGWVNYFKVADMKVILGELDKWLRRRIRMCYWKNWKKIKTKHDNLVRFGLPDYKAWEYANTSKGYWRISNSPILSRTLTNKYLENIGLISIKSCYCK